MLVALEGCERESKCEGFFNKNTKNSFQNRGGTTRPLPRDEGAEQLHNSQAAPQGLDQRSKMEEVVPKMACQRRTDARQSRRRWFKSCRGCPQALQEEFSCFILHGYEDKRRLWLWQRSQDSLQWTRRGRASYSEETKGIWKNRKLWERFRLQLE